MILEGVNVLYFPFRVLSPSLEEQTAHKLTNQLLSAESQSIRWYPRSGKGI
jgi:hypothetical protein